MSRYGASAFFEKFCCFSFVRIFSFLIDFHQVAVLQLFNVFHLYIFRPRPSYREVSQNLERYFYLQKNVEKYEVENPKDGLSETDSVLIQDIQNRHKRSYIESFGKNQSPVFLIEMMLINKKYKRSYLGTNFKKGMGLDDKELAEIKSIYGINSTSTFARNCSHYRQYSIDQWFYRFDKRDFEEAILFLYGRIEKENERCYVSILQGIIKVYYLRFS